ncbi:MAG: Rid family hydrolase [Acidimicrobiales bacterium]
MTVVHRPLAQTGSHRIVGLDGFGPGPDFSDAVRIELGAGLLVLVSGKVARRTAEDTAPLDMRTQAQRIFADIGRSLEREGGGLANVVRMRIYVTDISGPAVRALHEVRAELFAHDRFPASTLVQVSGFVVDEAQVEIEVEAFIPR